MSTTLRYVGGTGHHLYVEYPSLNSTHALAAPGVSIFQYESFQTLGGINYDRRIADRSIVCNSVAFSAVVFYIDNACVTRVVVGRREVPAY